MTAVLTNLQLDVLAALQDGLPLTPHPYAAVAERVGCTEAQVIAVLDGLESTGVIKRFGLVVRHRELGYNANAMVVFQVPPAAVDEAGEALARLNYVTLCYQRRSSSRWPYNLYCMIHGRDRDTVLTQVAAARSAAGIAEFPHRVLFSLRRFKQCGGRYVTAVPGAASDGRAVRPGGAGWATGVAATPVDDL